MLGTIDIPQTKPRYRRSREWLAWYSTILAFIPLLPKWRDTARLHEIKSSLGNLLFSSDFLLFSAKKCTTQSSNKHPTAFKRSRLSPCDILSSLVYSSSSIISENEACERFVLVIETLHHLLLFYDSNRTPQKNGSHLLQRPDDPT